MSGWRTSLDVKIEECRRRVGSGSEEHKAMGAFVAEGPMLVGGLHVGEIAFGMRNPC